MSSKLRFIAFKRACERRCSLPKPVPSPCNVSCFGSFERFLGSSLAHFFLLFSFFRHSSDFAPVYNWSAVTESFERSFTATFVCTSSNVSMDTMVDAGASSGAMNDAPCDDVSRFLRWWLFFFTNCVRANCRAMMRAKGSKTKVTPRSRDFFRTQRMFSPQSMGLQVVGTAGHNCFLI